MSERHFGEQHAIGRDGVGEPGVLRRIDMGVAARHCRYRAGRETATVGGGVDAAGEPRGNDKSGLAEIAREAFGELDAGGRCVARTHDGDHRLRQHGALAAHRDDAAAHRRSS